MKKKIVITGALGYLGTELCKLYSGESSYHKIVAIDDRFISEIVNKIEVVGNERISVETIAVFGDIALG